MVSGRKKKKGPVNVPKLTRPTPMERIAVLRKQHCALQMHNEDPPSAPPSPARDPMVNQGNNIQGGYRPESPDCEDEEEEELARRQPAEEQQEHALVSKETHRKVNLMVTQPNATYRLLLPARQQV